MGKLFSFLTINLPISSIKHLHCLLVFISQSMMESRVHSSLHPICHHQISQILPRDVLSTNKLWRSFAFFWSKTNIDGIRKSINNFRWFCGCVVQCGAIAAVLCSGYYYSTTLFNKTLSQILHRFEYWSPRVKYLRWCKPWTMTPSGNNGQCHSRSIIQQNNSSFIDILECEKHFSIISANEKVTLFS